jgi:hypothetical protein
MILDLDMRLGRRRLDDSFQLAPPQKVHFLMDFQSPQYLLGVTAQIRD